MVTKIIVKSSYKNSNLFKYEAENQRIQGFHQRSFGHIKEMLFSTNQVIPQIARFRQTLKDLFEKLSKNREISRGMNENFDKNGNKIYEEFSLFSDLTTERIRINTFVSDRLSNLLVRLQNAGKNTV